MKCLYIFNVGSGSSFSIKKRNYIKDELIKIYEEVIVDESLSALDFISKCEKFAPLVDVILFSGGDGTFNMVVNALANIKNPPILGCLPSGTLNDSYKDFGYKRNIKKCLKIIKKGKTTKLDLGKINNSYFIYSASIGAYSDIPFNNKIKNKKMFKKCFYYLSAIPKVFKKKKIHANITLDNKESFDIDASFLLILNSKYMGGFKINKRNVIDDGYFHLIYSKIGVFNSLLNYFIFKKRVKNIKFKTVSINIAQENYWSLDGEKGPKSIVNIEVLPQKFTIFTK